MVKTGLTSIEARARLAVNGPNTVPDERPHRIFQLLSKFWGPIPWMLEFSLVLEHVSGHYTQAVVISALLVFNALTAYFQESKAQDALNLLKQKLEIQAKVLRDGAWKLLPAREIVPEDVIYLRAGDLVPADVKLLDGILSIDQSTLTGESLPVERGANDVVFAGSVVQHGEANAEVITTGQGTYYGKTAQLVHTSRTGSHIEMTILGIVRYLVVLDSLLVCGVLVYSWVYSLPFAETLPFAIMLLVASVPVALPAMFTLAGALGAQELTRNGVLVTRLSAIEEAAALDILCSDKTGTITQNQLTLSRLLPFSGHSEDDLLYDAALGSEEATQDPIDLAILAAARQRSLINSQYARLQFSPFDPSTKRTQAIIQTDTGIIRVVKGYPAALLELVSPPPDFNQQVEQLADQGNRVLAVAAGPEDGLEMVGLLGFFDPPRTDSKDLIQHLEELAVRVVLITGDGLATARAVARQIDLGATVCSADAIRQGSETGALDCDVVAGVLPEDKFHLVQWFQKSGHIVGMTGDGVNDAPALKQAEVGIAVMNATDVAKAAASIVLTEPGLINILSAIKIGRQIYQRMLTYTLNKLVKTFQISLFLSLALLMTGLFVITPRLVIFLLFANDFVTMSLASDRVGYSPKPERWQTRPLILSGLVMALAWLLFSFGVLYIGMDYFNLGIDPLQTLVFAMLVFTGLANVYLIRSKGHFWKSPPGTALMISTVVDCLVVAVMVTQGILMTPISLLVLGVLVSLVVIYMLIFDGIKVMLNNRIYHAKLNHPVGQAA